MTHQFSSRYTVRILFPGMIFLACFASVFSCRNLFEKLSEAAQQKEKTLTNEKQNIQMTIPKGWREDTSLNEQADLQASNRRQEGYVIVLSENKEDFDQMDAEKHSELTSGAILSKIEKGERSPRKKILVNGKDAYQYVIHGVTEHMKLTYLHTTIDGTNHYHQIMAWTLKSKFRENEAVLKQVTDSFKERTGK